MKSRIIFSSIILAASVLLPLASQAVPLNSGSKDFRVAQEEPQSGGFQGRKKGNRGRNKAQWLKQQLNLTPAQEETIQGIIEASKQEMLPLMQQMRALKQELRQLKANNASEAEIQAKLEEIKPLRSQFKQQRQAMMAKIRAELTPEQQQKLDELKQQRQQRRDNRSKRFNRQAS
ncbi:MAG: Spy/CpxP family protein refolding chaperone [Nostocaceae cyanobacterium]|nr:Spy/CpxP family protein refolding chaperone [Nostocaceae cyanobacterium]